MSLAEITKPLHERDTSVAACVNREVTVPMMLLQSVALKKEGGWK